MSTATTQGIRVSVHSDYRPEQSQPRAGRWLFSYTVRVANEGPVPAQLVARHWIISDAAGGVEEVQGEGVVGRQPRLEPGRSFEYSSYCVLRTPHGSMRGSYRMVRDDGEAFDAEIAPFALLVPQQVN